MTTIFKGATNGGANRFFVKDEKVMVAGADVAGRQEVNIDVLEDVWGFETKSLGSLTGPIDDIQISVREIMVGPEDARVGTGDYRVVISGDQVGGQYRFDFTDDFYKDVNTAKLEGTGKFAGNGLLENSGIQTDGEVSNKTEGAAMNFALFLEQMLEADALQFIEDAGADPDVFTNDEEAIATARFRENDGDVIFSGGGVSGRTTTDEFESRSQAEDFIDTIQLAADGNGFLDDILV